MYLKGGGLLMMHNKIKNIKGIVAYIMVLVLCSSLLIGIPIKSYAAETKTNVSVDDMKKSMEKVVKSIDEMKEMMTPEQADNLEKIFSGFFNTATDIGGSAINVIDGATTFLKLIGVMKDANMQALADISEQLKLISDKLEIMDKKLDEIIGQMTAMHAEGEFNNRTGRAIDMNRYWVDFETEYMENQMDSLMREYEASIRDLAKSWIEDRSDDARHTMDYEPVTNKVVLLYRHDSGLIEHTLKNNIDPVHSRSQVEKADPYTLYADEFNPSLDSFMILDDSFLPHEGDILWDVNTYRTDLKDYFKESIKTIKDDDTANYELLNIDPMSWSDDDIEEYANDAADAIMYRINYYAVNKSADFSSRVKQQYVNFCNHMVAPQEGMKALLQEFYLSHAFEYEVSDDIKAVCNQMILKTGVYSMFTMNVLGASVYTTDGEKQEAADAMCNSIDKLEDLLNNGITGHGNYCYVTNTLIDYGEYGLTSSVDVNYRVRGHVSEYQSCGNGKIDSYFEYDDKNSGNEPVLIGDSNALVIAYHLASNGNTFDQEYMEKNLSKQPIERRSGVVTALKGVENLPLDASCKMKANNVIGNWFSNNPVVTLNNLPSGCTSGYINYKRGVNGSIYTGGLSVPTANKRLIGTAVYGETHWYWEKDESAIMGGPYDDPSFTQNIPPRVRTDISFWGDEYYRQSYSNSVKYNCLIQVPLNAQCLCLTQ